MKNLKNPIAMLLFIFLFISCSSSNNPNSECDECVYNLASGEVAGTVAVPNGTYELTLHFPTTESPFTEGTKGIFTITNNELTVEIEGKDCIIIKNPILTTSGSTEVKFKDSCRDEISFDVSEVNGQLNEINISTLDGTWLGQFNNR